MRKILYILVASLVATMVASCKSKAVVTHMMYDTITIERAIVQEVVRHDTLTVHDSTEIVREIVRYDTLGRITETQKERIRNGRTEERGEHLNAVTTDTIFITRTVTKTVTKKEPRKKCPSWLWWAIGIALAMMIQVIYKFYTSNNYER